VKTITLSGKSGGKAKGKGMSMSINIKIPGLGGRVKSKVLTTFTRQLSILQDAGLPILRSLRILEQQATSGALKNSLIDVCDEIEGAHTWDVRGRGTDSRVIIDLDQPWGTSESCTGCGKCVNVCPTGALAEKGRATAEMTKKRQFLPYLTIMREEDWE